ncbi:MAG: HAMP domain-containing histidine kinase [Desulfobacteraceae bacterium]|nr:HAMP domain-containing histidine kinase [Desulfobacteraceae bacterium]
MKLKRLYIKLFLSFVGVLFVTEVLILALFIVTAGRSFRDHIDKQSIAKLSIFKGLIQEKINNAPLIPITQNDETKELLQSFSNLFDVKIWITSPDNTVLLKTFSTPIDIIQKKRGRHEVSKDGIKLYHLSRRHIRYYAQIPIEAEGKINTLHIHLQKEHERKPEAVFLFGLLSIGTIIAILIVPLARVITKRIKQLNQSALDFADGNLSCRTDIKGYDEIAELGKSFNFMADKLEKMIQGNKELTANISHELRSPLTRIRVSKELIQDRLDPHGNEDINRYVQNIEADIKILDNLINKILKLSKINIQESSLSVEQLDFKILLTDLKKKYTSSLNQKNLLFQEDIDGSLILNTDKGIVTSVLSNLFDNAIKYTPKNGTIHINVFKPNEGKLTFCITNSYRKLDPLELENLFEPFYRIKNNKNPGSGMGLTIVKKQLKQCNSQIIARNSKTGLTFQVQFSNL